MKIFLSVIGSRGWSCGISRCARRFWTVIESLVDDLVAVEEGVAALLRVWLFVVFMVGIIRDLLFTPGVQRLW